MTDRSDDARELRRLDPEPLLAETFSPWGEVIDLDSPSTPSEPRGAEGRWINEGTALETTLARVQLRGGSAPNAESVAGIRLYRARPRDLPFELQVLERHPLGAQAFVPLEPVRLAVVVAGSDESPGPDTVRLFLTSGRRGVCFRPGVWHHPLVLLDRPARLLVVDRLDTSDNLEEIDVRSWRLALPTID